MLTRTFLRSSFPRPLASSPSSCSSIILLQTTICSSRRLFCRSSSSSSHIHHSPNNNNTCIPTTAIHTRRLTTTSPILSPAASSPPSSSSSSSSSLYRSPLRSSDDREFQHLWQSAWTLPASAPHQFTLVWMHGLGQNIETLKTMINIIQPPVSGPNESHTKVIVPQGPKLSISCLPNDPDQHAWFDVLTEQLSVDKEAAGQVEEDVAGLEDMVARVHELLDKEIGENPSVPSSHIVLAGFDQGGAVALHAGLSYPQKIAGIISLASYLPAPEAYPSQLNAANAQTPILALHGNSDFVVPLAFAKKRYEVLQKLKVPIQIKTEWSMGHFLSNASLMATQNWMAYIFSKLKA